MDDDKMIISVKSYGNEYIVKLPEDANIYEAICACNACLLGATYSQKTILKGMKEFLDEKDEFEEYDEA